jgi:hypothetical protein
MRGGTLFTTMWLVGLTLLLAFAVRPALGQSCEWGPSVTVRVHDLNGQHGQRST